jgi:hypothetical protein
MLRPFPENIGLSRRVDGRAADLLGVAHQLEFDGISVIEDRQMKSAKERGEHPGYGPEWACDEYGVGFHDYDSCLHCKARYRTYMQAKESLASMGLLPQAQERNMAGLRAI